MKIQQGIWRFIVNPVAGKVSDRKISELEHTLVAAFPGSILHRSRYAGDASELARIGLREGIRQFCVIGGDGTIHEVVNGLLAEGPVEGLRLAVLPMGSGNDWARSLGFRNNVPVLIERLRSGKSRTADVGSITYQGPDGPAHRYFVNVAGLAYDAAVAETVRGKRYRFPQWIYLYEAVRQLFAYRAPEVALSSDALLFTGKAFTINIGVQPYSGGGMQLVPHARNLDGQFALTVMESRPGWVLLPRIPRLYDGKIGRIPFVHTGASENVEVLPVNGTVPLEADGEFLGHAPARFSILPGAIHYPVL